MTGIDLISPRVHVWSAGRAARCGVEGTKEAVRQPGAARSSKVDGVRYTVPGNGKARWPVVSFRDRAVAHLGKNARGQMSVTRVDLHPEVLFDAGFSVETVELEKMRHRAHRCCFIANTLADSVEIDIL